jgi:hypothetical protein
LKLIAVQLRAISLGLQIRELLRRDLSVNWPAQDKITQH